MGRQDRADSVKTRKLYSFAQQHADTGIAINKAIFYDWSPQTHVYVMSVEDRFGPGSRAADPSDAEG